MPNNTHYDNLKVPRDASTEAIRAAYKELAQKYSANQNPSADASRQMKIIHNSYSILSNPIQKNKYDQWLLEQESESIGVKKAGSGGTSGQAAGNRSNIYPLRPVEPVEPGPAEGKIDGILDLTLVAGNEIAEIPEQGDGNKRGRWLIFGAVGLLVLATLAWFGLPGDAADSDNRQLPMANDAVAEAGQSSPTAAVGNALPVPESGNGEILLAAADPTHDPVAIDAFVGKWKGVNGATPVQQSLEISLKSADSIVFRLDSKSGKNIGGIYGIAGFENGHARFYNKEYGCSIVFTSQSNAIKVATSGCQPFYRDGAIFDGAYMKPDAIRKTAKAAVPAMPAAPAPVEGIASPPPQPQAAQTAVPRNVPKLRKYTATVKDADGNVSSIELLAKDKDAARKIIRDFRGDPEVVKLKELKK